MSSSEKSNTPTAAAYAVAIDIGGTFTDISLLDRTSGAMWRAKTPSVPSDPSIAFMTGVNLVLDDAGLTADALGQVLHGTTVATNMILEGRGAKTALVTTRGFRHVLEIGRQDIPRHANLFDWVKPRRPVPASRIFEIDERTGTGGIVLENLDEDSVAKAADAIRATGAEAVAICLVHAYANPDHENRVAALLREALPDLAVTASSDILPVVREYERSLATVLNAGVMPGVSTYVARLESRLSDAGVTSPLLLMQSNGGVAGTAAIRRAPALTALSGPAAGVVGACAVAAACGIEDLITVDIGGTSADICLVQKGKVGLTQNGRVGDWPLSLPMVDMVTIGAGGGSVAGVADGTLSVGPRSAGASPGPAAYGHGGTEPTVTDAHVVLGHLPVDLLGGRMTLDQPAAQKAVEGGVATPLGLAPDAAARGILAIVNNNMVGAVRTISVQRGHDPRNFTLVPFGGAGPLHGCALADLLGISQVMVPPAPGLLCADGLLTADLKAEFTRALPTSGPIDQQKADTLFDALEADAQAWLDHEKVPAAHRETMHRALLRFHGQGGEIAVEWRATPTDTETAFRSAHTALYGFVLDAAIELVTLRVEAAGRTTPSPRHDLAEMPPPEPTRLTTVLWEGGPQETPIYDRKTLGTGARVTGPMILTQLDTTTIVPPGWAGNVHPSGALILRKEAAL